MPFTGVQAWLTAAIARRAPVRSSWGSPPPLLSAITQRTLPALTASASQLAVTSLSRPEKPPMPATFASVERIALAPPDWLGTAIVPPPSCRA